MSNVRAPWTPLEVERLKVRQADETKHPYTCKNEHVFVPTVDGFVCECGETQKWCHRSDINGILYKAPSEEGQTP